MATINNESFLVKHCKCVKPQNLPNHLLSLATHTLVHISHTDTRPQNTYTIATKHWMQCLTGHVVLWPRRLLSVCACFGCDGWSALYKCRWGQPHTNLHTHTHNSLPTVIAVWGVNVLIRKAKGCTAFIKTPFSGWGARVCVSVVCCKRRTINVYFIFPAP